MNGFSKCFTALCFFCALEVTAEDKVFSIFGNLNIAYDWRNEAFGELDENDWVNYASKLGFRGDFNVTESLELVYEVEHAFYPIHGGTRFSELVELDKAIVGVRGEMGTLLFGTYDTPLKMAQVGIDLFSDQSGDIAAVVAGEGAAHDAFMYYSPDWNGWQIRAMHVPADNHFSESLSVSATYESSDWRIGLASDSNMRRNNLPLEFTVVRDTYRAAAVYTPGNWSFGLLFEHSKKEKEPGSSWESAYVGSLRYKIGNIAVLGQYGYSNTVGDKVMSRNVGLEYYFTDNIKAYLYQWDYDSAVEVDTISLGMKIDF